MKFIQSLNLKDRIFEKFLQANDLLNESDIKYTLKRFEIYFATETNVMY